MPTKLPSKGPGIVHRFVARWRTRLTLWRMLWRLRDLRTYTRDWRNTMVSFQGVLQFIDTPKARQAARLIDAAAQSVFRPLELQEAALEEQIEALRASVRFTGPVAGAEQLLSGEAKENARQASRHRP